MDKEKGKEFILEFIANNGVEDKDSLSDRVKRRKKVSERKKINDMPELDLHGMVAYIAEKRILDFIRNEHKRGTRKVLIIHGKGIHTPDIEEPVLKNVTNSVLHSELNKHVKEFYLLPGNSGATIVVLH